MQDHHVYVQDATHLGLPDKSVQNVSLDNFYLPRFSNVKYVYVWANLY